MRFKLSMSLRGNKIGPLTMISWRAHTKYLNLTWSSGAKNMQSSSFGVVDRRVHILQSGTDGLLEFGGWTWEEEDFTSNFNSNSNSDLSLKLGEVILRRETK